MLQTLHIIATALLAFFSLALGFYSLYTNSKVRVVQLWFAMSIAVGLWSGALFLALTTANDQIIFLWYSKLLHVGASFIPIFFCHFVLEFLFRARTKKIFLAVGYALAAIFALLSLAGPYIVSGVSSHVGFRMWLDAGNLYPLFCVYFLFYTLSAWYFLYQSYRQSDGFRRRQIYFVLLAAIVGFGGGSSNMLPQLFNIFPSTHFVTWLYPILITYGIFMDQIEIRFKPRTY